MSLTQTYEGRGGVYLLRQNTPAGEEYLRPVIDFYVEDRKAVVTALLDSGAKYCVLHRDLVEELGFDDEPRDLPLSSRHGTVWGTLQEVRLRLSAEEGTPLDMAVPCFVSREWPGPSVIGWEGCLEVMRFALDWAAESFYFASPGYDPGE